MTFTEIARGTTPTIKIKFDTINVSNITKAILSVKQQGQNKIETNTFTNVNTTDKTISFKLTQSQTLSLVSNQLAVVVCDWLLNDDTRGRSKAVQVKITDPAKEGVISND